MWINICKHSLIILYLFFNYFEIEKHKTLKFILNKIEDFMQFCCFDTYDFYLLMYVYG